MALSPFFVVLGVLFPSLAVGSASALVFRRARPAWCVAAPVAAAVVIGLVAAGIADGISGLGNYAAVAAIVALFSAAVAAPTAALGRLWPPLVAVAILVFMMFGMPVSGGPSGLASFGPGFLRVLHPALPLGAAASAVRGAVYFDGYGIVGPLWTLAAWAACGVAALALVTGWRRRISSARAGLVAVTQPGAVTASSALEDPAHVPGGQYVHAEEPHLTPQLTTAGPASGSSGSLSDVPGTLAGGAAEPEGAEPPGRAPWSAEEAAAEDRSRDEHAGGSGPGLLLSLVVGFDDSRPAQRALSWATRLLATHPGTLHVIYVDRAIIDSDLSGFGHAEMEADRDREAAEVQEVAEVIAAGSGIPYTFERRRGAAAEAILAGTSAVAAASGSDPVIVVGRSGHTLHHVLGSVPVHLLHHSAYPVLTIP
jgi:nucleotide-binding universal stress UspA family protein